MKSGPISVVEDAGSSGVVAVSELAALGYVTYASVVVVGIIVLGVDVDESDGDVDGCGSVLYMVEFVVPLREMDEDDADQYGGLYVTVTVVQFFGIVDDADGHDIKVYVDAVVEQFLETDEDDDVVHGREASTVVVRVQLLGTLGTSVLADVAVGYEFQVDHTRVEYECECVCRPVQVQFVSPDVGRG